MSFDELESIEIVESDIIDNTIEVGSGCEWRGRGKEPQWDNPKSTKAYDHKCYLREFGYSTNERIVVLNKQQFLDELKRFLIELMDIAVNLGYISLEDKNEFIKPAFSDSKVLV